MELTGWSEISEFEVGVWVVTENGKGIIIVTEKHRDEIWHGVKHDEYKRAFHNLEGRCENGYGYWYKEKELKFCN